jgi:hypothetical protein
MTWRTAGGRPWPPVSVAFMLLTLGACHVPSAEAGCLCTTILVAPKLAY